MCNSSLLLKYSLGDGDLTPGCEWLHFFAVWTQAKLHPAFQTAVCTLLRLKAFRETRFFVKICLSMFLGVAQRIMQQVRAGQSRSRQAEQAKLARNNPGSQITSDFRNSCQ